MGQFSIQDGQTILFIGDSITDCGRRDVAPPLGNGYVFFFSQLVMAYYPERNIKYINTGIGGNKITDLKARWDQDALSYKPDWLSIKIGINDLHSYLSGDPAGVTPQLYAEIYDYLLHKTLETIDCNLILIEPFYISKDRSGQTFESKVLETLPRYIEIVHRMSEKYNTKLVRFHEMFQKQLNYREASTFCPEPVHPNQIGHLIMAVELFNVLNS